MIKQLLINGQVNRYTLSNRARQAIAFQYITDTKTLRLIDTYTNVAVNLVENGDNALTSSAMERIWQYIQSRVDSKTGGAFKFRGNVDDLSSVLNPKAGDVYQVTISTGMYDPDTGQLIPSSIQYNDKEYSWAEKVDPNTGLPIGGQWIELGFNFSTSGTFITKQWVEKYMQTKQQAALEHEQLSAYINTVSSNVTEYIDQTATNLSSYVDQTAATISSYISTVISSSNEYIDTVSTALFEYINNTVSTSIIYYINGKVGELSGHIRNLSTYVDTQDAALSAAVSTAINNLSTYVYQQDEALSTAVDNLSAYMINRMDVEDGGFVTNDQLEALLDDIKNRHQQDLTIIEYDDEGNPITSP